jgi:hypothetical protein
VGSGKKKISENLSYPDSLMTSFFAGKAKKGWTNGADRNAIKSIFLFDEKLIGLS